MYLKKFADGNNEKRYTEVEKKNIEERELQHNGEGYYDPTAYKAIKRVECNCYETEQNGYERRPYPTHVKPYRRPDTYKQQRTYSPDGERFYKLLGCIYRVCELAGFDVEGRITLVDKQTGKVWR